MIFEVHRGSNANSPREKLFICVPSSLSLRHYPYSVFLNTTPRVNLFFIHLSWVDSRLVYKAGKLPWSISFTYELLFVEQFLLNYSTATMQKVVLLAAFLVLMATICMASPNRIQLGEFKEIDRNQTSTFGSFITKFCLSAVHLNRYCKINTLFEQSYFR